MRSRRSPRASTPSSRSRPTRPTSRSWTGSSRSTSRSCERRSSAPTPTERPVPSSTGPAPTRPRPQIRRTPSIPSVPAGKVIRTARTGLPAGARADPRARSAHTYVASRTQGDPMAGETPITLVGNLTADPELRFTPSGAAVANFTVASTPRTFDRQSNEWRDGDAMFLNCAVWRQAAENVAESLQKGMRVIVQGRLKSRSYETREGEKRTVFEVDVDEIGPALRYATAKVTRTSGGGGGGGGGGRSSGGGGNQGGGSFGGDPWATGGGSGGGSRGGQS